MLEYNCSKGKRKRPPCSFRMLGNDLKNFQKKTFEKPLDKKQILCYNKDVRKREGKLLKTRKGNTMTMTKKDALTIALNTIDNAEAKSVIESMIAQLSKPRTPKSEEAKAKANAQRKAKTAVARAELVAKVAPVLREGLSHTLEGLTAKELFTEVADKLPADFTAPKVQNVLLREMRDELVITEAKGHANTYRLK